MLCSHSLVLYNLCGVWEGTSDRGKKQRERTWETIISLLSYSSVLWKVCEWGDLEASGSQHPVLCPMNLFSSILLLPWLRERLEQQEPWESWLSKQKKAPYTGTSKLCSSCPSLKVLNEHSGTSELPQAQWSEQCLSSCDLMEGWDWVMDRMSREEGAGQMSTKISPGSIGSQPNSYRCFKQMIDGYLTYKK